MRRYVIESVTGRRGSWEVYDCKRAQTVARYMTKTLATKVARWLNAEHFDGTGVGSAGD